MLFPLSLILYLLVTSSSACPHYTRSTSPPSDYAAVLPASELLSKAIAALGGTSALSALTGITYHVPNHYRSTSLMESYSPFRADNFIASSGHQTISFSFSSLQQRIDRFHTISDEWIWGSPNLAPMNYTLVVHARSGNDTKACYTSGNNIVYNPRDMVGGCVDPVHDPATNLTIILDPVTYLPHTIRSQTGDLRVYNYTQVSGVLLPRRFLILQGTHVLEDFLAEEISVNPEFPGEYFSASAPTGFTPGMSYSPSELASYSGNMLPATPYTGTFQNLLVTLPLPGLSTLHHLYFNDAPGYRQLVLEFPDAIIVVDAPPKQSLLVLQWVKEKLGREVTHVWVSHHHGDHALGASDYVAAGAKLIIPEIARKFWADTVPDAELLTFSEGKPFTHASASMATRFHWSPNQLHAEDWSYAHIVAAEGEAVFVTDIWNPDGDDDEGVVVGDVRQWLDQAVADGVGRNATVVPAHGKVNGLLRLIEYTGFDYPADVKSMRV
ncbi:hypothetical protein BDD12DRAFT_728744 [Trichophaea hybrida]|nr:hypothetical protein BDD12DRAFT_728744 [Trichophaea hybrida]